MLFDAQLGAPMGAGTSLNQRISGLLGASQTVSALRSIMGTGDAASDDERVTA
ncbi:hypothetical protein BN1012_Phect1896 [Candidatus Phaeomarinobacter ectocarpi]|uniref:Uncharacterized protein n=1 Tax=Candidatus Phaeomarinibacter ectocarpi TaxID=1458461 RepID=X5MFS1_9HYPH|nr:hypothetical protein BN1012_Phect1896 [Candidatus Phaeomarinobacter ectocarpi]